jgi:bifunctional enzyme CysN/CysC
VPLKQLIESKNLRIPIQDVMNLDGERIYMGHVASGNITVGDTIRIQPNGRETEVVKLYEANKEVNSISMGNAAGVVMKDKIFADRGDVVTLSEEKSEPSRQITVSVFWFAKEMLKVNHQLTMKVSTTTTIARVVAIKSKLDSSTLQVTKEDSEFIEEGDTAELVLSLESPIFVDNHSDVIETGRIILQRDAHIVGGGIIKVAREDTPVSAANQSTDSHKRTIVKSITWRVIATITTTIITFLVTDSLKLAGAVGTADTLIKIIFYYFHERYWDQVEFGRKSNNSEILTRSLK